MTDTQRIDKSITELRPLRLKPVGLRQLEPFLRTLSGPVALGEPAARRTQ